MTLLALMFATAALAQKPPAVPPSSNPAPSPYAPPANAADPAAQLAEMLDIYETACLRAFPDERAVARAMAGRGASALSEGQVHVYLHEDPGHGWRIAGRTGIFNLTIENPPYHACAVRTMTAAGFPDLGPYQALANRYEAGRGFAPMRHMEFTRDNIEVAGGGEQRATPDGGSESLLVIIGTPVPAFRRRGDTAVEVRFTHQFTRSGAE
jgi:hypothetical protein